MSVLLGNERLFTDALDIVAGKRLGLITNPTGLDSRLRATADRLHEAPDVELVALFGPEHGIRGDSEDGITVADGVDARTGVPSFSLYGNDRKPRPAVLADVDCLLFDIQDVGVRFYTYLYTMSLAMMACAGLEKPFVVLDRPNPIGGDLLEGNTLDPEFSSFVGMYPIPVRYALTIGEVARLFNDAFGIGADLHVVDMAGWRRDMLWDATGLPWVSPSPNMPSPQTALVYPGMCFFEGTNLSEGRGTAKPFEQIGAPYIDGHRLADEMNCLRIPGVMWRAVYFRPSFGKHAGELCSGVQLHVTEPRLLRPVAAAFHLMARIKSLWPSDFHWHLRADGIHNFDRLAGTDSLRRALDNGTQVDELLAVWKAEQRAFSPLRTGFLHY